MYLCKKDPLFFLGYRGLSHSLPAVLPGCKSGPAQSVGLNMRFGGRGGGFQDLGLGLWAFGFSGVRVSAASFRAWGLGFRGRFCVRRLPGGRPHCNVTRIVGRLSTKHHVRLACDGPYGAFLAKRVPHIPQDYGPHEVTTQILGRPLISHCSTCLEWSWELIVPIERERFNKRACGKKPDGDIFRRWALACAGDAMYIYL